MLGMTSFPSQEYPSHKILNPINLFLHSTGIYLERLQNANAMGCPPAVIIVIRHGTRLDAADPQWHLTSPTPYDPPLTYGGWCQSKVLGARIASILQSRENDEELPETNKSSLGSRSQGRRQHKIIIHTSPYLRCVQTSVGISAGLAQNAPTHNSTSKNGRMLQKGKFMHSSPLIRPTVMGTPSLSSIPEPAVALDKAQHVEQNQKIRRITLRVDAFLGEWLTPDYFDQITPPPSSVVLVATAKSDLLRREDYSHLTQAKDFKANQPFPGGWGNSHHGLDPKSEHERSKIEEPLSNMSLLSAALPNRERLNTRERASSLIMSGSHGSRHKGSTMQIEPPGAQDADGIYQPPYPNYAISNSDPIPPGFVPHARDACVEVDYQWDSMREPQNWGKGGEYGEEWSSMHMRFRSGLQNLVTWYQKSDESSKNINRNRSNSLRIFSPEEEAARENTDLVVILVTHGAGCNALIGALTNQPVLLDVGMASLTMAVSKPTLNSATKESSSEATEFQSFAPRKNTTVHAMYDVKLIANNEHLRSSTNSTPSSSRAPSVTGFTGAGDRLSTLGNIDFSNLNRSRPQSSSLGSIRRTSSVTVGGGYVTRSYVPSRVNSTGLWSASRCCDEVEEDNLILDFGNTEFSHTQSGLSLEKKPASNLDTEVRNNFMAKDVHDPDNGKRGLWGSLKASSAT